MDHVERKQLKRADDSRESWKAKALERQKRIRSYQDRIRYLEKVVGKQTQKINVLEPIELPKKN